MHGIDMISGVVTRNRKRLMAYGILSVLLGIIGIYMSVEMTLASMLVFGVFLVVAGIIFLIESFSAPE